MQPRPPFHLADLIGEALAQRLAQSETRPLILLYEAGGPVDAVPWESLALGAGRLCQQHALSRQLLADSAPSRPLPEAVPVMTLRALQLGPEGGTASLRGLPFLGLQALASEAQRRRLMDADAICLPGEALQRLTEHGALHHRRRLLLLSGAVPLASLAAALEAGAVVACFGPESAAADEAQAALLRLVAEGLAIGEALRQLHRRPGGLPQGTRLYGDPDLRLVRPAARASRRQVSSLSFDLVGSTRLMRTLGDEAYAETLEAVHRCCADIVRRHGGQPDEPQGDDGVMGYFGHPVAMENAAERAVAAAWAMSAAVAELGVQLRIGVATGPVVVMGGQPVGLSIHLAARLQQAARPGSVLVSEATQRLVRHAFVLQARTDLPTLKGVEGEGAYELVDMRRPGQPLSVTASAAALPMVGREAELERLQAAWRRVQGGERCLITVSAEAGMGKSRLVREFHQRLGAEGADVLELLCRAEAIGSPFLSLGESMRRWLAVGLASPAQVEALQRLAAALPEQAREPPSPALRADLPGAARRGSEEVARSRRIRLLNGLVEGFRQFTEHRPCCLIVEDWHWGDPSTREFVDKLLRTVTESRLLIVITMRAPDPALPVALLPHEHLALTGLGPVAARELVARMCAARPVPQRLIQQLAQRGDGVPLFLEEAAHLALEQGGGADEAQALQAVPDTLKGLLMARLDALGTSKSLAQEAAVLGRGFSREFLLALLDAPGRPADPDAIERGLDVLCAAGILLREGGGRYLFRHALIRDEAYASLLEREQQTLHTRMVELLNTRWRELAAEQPELLAHHQTQAGLHTKAVEQWELAARHATARNAQQEALSHLNQALAVLERAAPDEDRDRAALRLRLRQAARLVATEGYGAEEVLTAYQKAQALCAKVGDPATRFRVEMGLEAYRFMRAEFQPALAHSRLAASIAQQSGDLKQALQAHWGLACTLFHVGALRASMAEMERALSRYTPALHRQFDIQDPGLMCMAYSAWGLWELGRPDEALARIHQAVRMAGEFEDRFSQAVVTAYAVSVELLRGDHEAAWPRVEACVQICESFGFPVWLAITRCMRGYLLCTRGDFDEGLREMESGHALWLRTGARVSQPLYLSMQVEGLLMAGRLQEAADRVEQGLAIVHRFGEGQMEAEMWRLRGEIALRRGDARNGEAWLRLAYGRALRRHRLGFALRAATALARHWAQQGRAARALRLLQPLQARWTQGRDTRDLRAATALLAQLQAQEQTQGEAA